MTVLKIASGKWLAGGRRWTDRTLHAPAQRPLLTFNERATPYRIFNGVNYLSPICHFAERVMARLPQPGTKTQRRWVKGIWAGRLERDGSHIILTAAPVTAT